MLAYGSEYVPEILEIVDGLPSIQRGKYKWQSVVEDAAELEPGKWAKVAVRDDKQTAQNDYYLIRRTAEKLGIHVEVSVRTLDEGVCVYVGPGEDDNGKG